MSLPKTFLERRTDDYSLPPGKMCLDFRAHDTDDLTLPLIVDTATALSYTVGKYYQLQLVELPDPEPEQQAE